MTTDCSFLAELDLRDDQVSFAAADRDHRGTDWGTKESEAAPPDAVVWAESTADIAAVLAAADERGVPVTPYAAGTGIEGNAVPTAGGVSLDTTRMDRVLDARPDDLQVDVEPGVVGAAVDDAVAGHGLFFPPLPTSGDIATVGGMIATDASGMRTVKYGTVGDWVRELEVVLADGTVLTVGTKAAKTSSGYNLRDLVVGSEGTLAVVTRATLRLAGLPEQVRGARVVFKTVDDAAAAVADVVRSGVDVSAIELLDAASARIANAYVGASLPDRPMLFVELRANHGVDTELEFCREVVAAHDPIAFETADGAALNDLWELRRELADAVRAFDPDLQSVHPGDVAVPVSRYPELLRGVARLAEHHDLLIPCFGHAGDGNVHFDVLVDPSDEAAVALGERVFAEVVDLAIEMGGTATGEHGIGRGKRQFLRSEHGEAGVRTMRTVKRALDPNGTLNPGKVLPDD
ncbi:FAD-binding oxidoreductase [Haloprofundus salilacus]|uniref:FAD-binding oxidoreductase n=1 Tax=Haloprofundus salilacus TaxID=2876190 RepID=UPI001CC9AF91|nr:FAD-linked oxidase C-terminal domain-containing protein [Haloprofundus salilacus]